MFFKKIIVATLLLPVVIVTESKTVQTPVEKSFMEYERFQGPKEKQIIRTAPPFVIPVSTQRELNDLSNNIRKAIKNGKKEIEVRISSGVYYYEKLPVYLYNLDAKNVSISIVGNNTIMVAGGKDYSGGKLVQSPDKDKVYLDNNRNPIDIYGDVQWASAPVEVLNQNTGECRLLIGTKKEYMEGLKIQLSEWYLSPVYDVSSIKDEYVYFIANDIKYDKAKKCFNVNYDYGMGDNNPRFRFIEPGLVLNSKTSIHECEVSQFLILYRSKIKSFSVSGIDFLGCAKGKDALIYFRDVEAEKISISNCKFEQIKYKIVKLRNTENFVFRDNIVRNCFDGAVYSYVDCPSTIVKNNIFYRAEMGWTNSSCVACYGKDFSIADNVFEDISYASIVSGFLYAWGKKIVGCGVIERNSIFYGEEYYNNPWKYTLYDSGAIYIGTQNKLVIVRYNDIHNYRGVRSKRGIYCDEGAMNVKIYGNVISGITNAHSLFSWRDRSMNKKLSASNDGIEVFYNLIWGNYKFDERPNSSCIHGKNIILYADGEEAPKNELTNFAYKEKDIVFSGVTKRNGRIELPSKAIQQLRQFPTYEKMKTILEKAGFSH